MRPRRRSRGAGFTLIELLIILVLIGILATFTVSALINTINRAKVSGTALDVAATCEAARLEAVKRSKTVRVEASFSGDSLRAYVDGDGDGKYTPPPDPPPADADILIATINLPKGIALHGPGDIATPNLNAIYNFPAPLSGDPGGVASFSSDGSVEKLGAFRFRDQRDNILEVRISPKASARVAVRKYAGDPNGTDDLTQYFESGEGKPGEGWTWN